MSTSPITSALLNSAYPPQQTDLFGRIDANSEGQISPDEMSAFGQNLPGASGTGLKNKNLFQKIDTNGDGIADGHAAGVGLVSMRERVAELGGRFHLGPSREGGVLIEVRIPVAGALDRTP